MSCPGKKQLKKKFLLQISSRQAEQFLSPEQIHRFIILREQVFILNKLKLEYKYILEHKLEYKW